jgi:hypothetical protein
MQDIMWQAANNNWFEYPMGSRFLYFCFPACYRTQALEGVRVFYKGAGPTSKRKQPPLQPKEQALLGKKIKKFIDKKYITPTSQKFSSLIKYFAVPKGVIGDMVQDWWIVFHAGANKPNDCMWCPSFSVNSLLRIVDKDTLMSDSDMVEMYLNFPLHPNTICFMAIGLGPLEYGVDECAHRWMFWHRNCMGFKSSPYNSVRTYLIAEEIIWGDRHNRENAFQWEYTMMNLPGTN